MILTSRSALAVFATALSFSVGCVPSTYGPKQMTEVEVRSLAGLLEQTIADGFQIDADTKIEAWKEHIVKEDFRWHNSARARSFKDGWGEPLRLICLKRDDTTEISIYSTGANKKFESFGGDDIYATVVFSGDKLVSRKLISCGEAR
jgi:hypothetical protein